MNSDKTTTQLIHLFRSLEHAHSDKERQAIVHAANRLNRKLDLAIDIELGLVKALKPKLSVLALRIHKRCHGQTLTGQVIARVVGRTYSGSIRSAIRELVDAKMAQKSQKNLYRFFSENANCPRKTDSTDSSLQFSENQKKAG